MARMARYLLSSPVITTEHSGIAPISANNIDKEKKVQLP